MDRIILAASLAGVGALVLLWGIYRLQVRTRDPASHGVPWFEVALLNAGLGLMIVACHVQLPEPEGGPVRPAERSSGLPTSQPTTSVPSVSRRLSAK